MTKCTRMREINISYIYLYRYGRLRFNLNIVTCVWDTHTLYNETITFI